MALVKFKRGLIANRGAAVDGLVYFATDSHELFMASGQNWIPFGDGDAKVRSVAFANGVLTIVSDVEGQLEPQTTTIDLASEIADSSWKVANAEGGVIDVTDNASSLTQVLDVNVDGSTILKSSGRLVSGLKLGYAAATEGADAHEARIELRDNNDNMLSSVNASSILGSGVVQSSSYDETTGVLTINFVGGQSVSVDLAKLIDFTDVAVKAGSEDYLDVTASAAEGGTQLQYGVKIVDVADATDSSTGLVDAYDVKSYVDNAVSSKNVSAEGDNYVSASAANNKVTVSADVQDLTASAGTRGNYTVSDDGEVSLSGETAPSISGVAQSLVDGADVAAKVATYVDAKVAAEAARTDANIQGAVKALDASVTSTGGSHVTVAITEVDGKLTAATVTESDIASASDLSDEVTRAKAAEGELATVIGATGAEGSRAWTPTTNYGGSSTSVLANMQALDAQIKANSDLLTWIEA